GERVPVLRPTRYEHERLVQDRLLPDLRHRSIPGDLQHPTVARARVVDLLAIQGFERDLLEGRGVWGVQSSHGCTGPTLAGRSPSRAFCPLHNLGFRCRYGKNVHSRSLGILTTSRPPTAASTSPTRYSDPQHNTTPSAVRSPPPAPAPFTVASATRGSASATRGSASATRGSASATRGSAAATRGTASTTACAACDLCAPSTITSGRTATTSSRPGQRAVRKPARTCSAITGNPRLAATCSSAHANAAFARW